MNYIEEFCEEIVIINKGNVVLKGNLKDIKKEFGENKIILSATNYPLNNLKDICLTRFNQIIKIISTKREFLIVELINHKNKNDLLKELINSDIDIELFGEYEPSLNDIFILKAGDEQ